MALLSPGSFRYHSPSPLTIDSFHPLVQSILFLFPMAVNIIPSWVIIFLSRTVSFYPWINLCLPFWLVACLVFHGFLPHSPPHLLRRRPSCWAPTSLDWPLSCPVAQPSSRDSSPGLQTSVLRPSFPGASDFLSLGFCLYFSEVPFRSFLRKGAYEVNKAVGNL